MEATTILTRGGVLDLVMKGRIDQVLDFTDPAAPHGSLAAPGAPFGQFLAAAFDEAVTPAEWKAFTGALADAALRDGCLEMWRVYVMPRFETRYCGWSRVCSSPCGACSVAGAALAVNFRLARVVRLFHLPAP